MKPQPFSSKSAPFVSRPPDLVVCALLFIVEVSAMYATLRDYWLHVLVILYLVTLHSFLGLNLDVGSFSAMLIGMSLGALLSLVEVRGEYAHEGALVGYVALSLAIMRQLSHSKSCTRPSC